MLQFFVELVVKHLLGCHTDMYKGMHVSTGENSYNILDRNAKEKCVTPYCFFLGRIKSRIN